MNLVLPALENCTLAIIGLGYVGLPLAVEFSRTHLCSRTNNSLHRRVIGFDIDVQRLEELRNHTDRTLEISSDVLQKLPLLEFTNNQDLLCEADVFIVTVPTPIDSSKRPDLSPLEKASCTIGRALRQRSSDKLPIVIFESTVYPGATEEVCVPVLERESGLVFNIDFFCGYSPERINPGDNQNKLVNIIKVTSGSTPKVAEWVNSFYGSIIKAGTHQAPSIKVAEAAKVIENTQRDLNIALVNELAIIFDYLNIDTLDVLEAAGTKWNFLPFRPGLVGGHCIGVDPYYLTYKSEKAGYYPHVVLAGRRINDGIGQWIVERLILKLAQQNKPVAGMNALILGLSFKENCPDLRNTKVVDIVNIFSEYGVSVSIVDPWVDKKEAQSEYQLNVYNEIPNNSRYDIVVLAVQHNQFVNMTIERWQALLTPRGTILDLKGIAPRNLNVFRL